MNKLTIQEATVLAAAIGRLFQLSVNPGDLMEKSEEEIKSLVRMVTAEPLSTPADSEVVQKKEPLFESMSVAELFGIKSRTGRWY